MTHPIISVIIPVYNAEKYLEATLESVRGQTFQDFEVICINDGSTDNSLNILQHVAAEDPRFKVFTQQNAGGSASRNKGLEMVKGDYIAFLDNDDLYHPQYLEILYNNIVTSDADISCCSYVRFEGYETYNFSSIVPSKHISFVSTKPFIDKFVHKKKINSLMWVKLYRRNVFDDIKFAETLPAINDMLLNIHVLLKASKVVVCEDKLIAYRIIETSQTMKALSAARIEEFKNLVIEISHLAEEFPQYKNKLKKIATRYAYGMCVKDYLHKYNPERDTQNYGHLIEVLHWLIDRNYISTSSLSFRRHLIIWAFLHRYFVLLKLIKE